MNNQKTLAGKIVSTKMNQTATVLIVRTKRHPKYLKQYTVSKKYLVHNPADKYTVGQTVEISSTKPISKRKSFIIIKEVKE